VKAFELVAAEAYNLTGGTGSEWEHICDLGRELDASNPLYRPGGQPGAATTAAVAAAASAPTTNQFNKTQAVQAQPPAASDVDLDLDFSLGDEPDTLSPPAAEPPVMPPAGRPPEPAATAPAPFEPLNMDFSAPPVAAPEPVRLETPSLNVDENSLAFEPVEIPHAPAPQAAPPTAAPAKAAEDGMLEFDLGGLSLDLPGSAASAAAAPAPAAKAPAMDPDATMAPLAFDLDTPPPAAAPVAAAPMAAASGGDGDSPLATKLALAEEFNAIGDADGARSLAEEVLAEASGDLKSRAQKLLAEIG
jgi:pilus assembly protein FimV